MSYLPTFQPYVADKVSSLSDFDTSGVNPVITCLAANYSVVVERAFELLEVGDAFGARDEMDLALFMYDTVWTYLMLSDDTERVRMCQVAENLLDRAGLTNDVNSLDFTFISTELMF